MSLDPIKSTVRALLEKTKATKADAELWPVLSNKLTTGMQLRKPFEWQWILNLAYLFGKQYHVVNAATSVLEELTRKPGEVRAQDNQILPRWRRQVTDFVKSKPEIAAVPASNEDEDRQAAKLATKVAKAFWFNRGMRGKLREAGVWLYACGNVFMGDCWNDRLEPMGFDTGKQQFVYAGDADCDVWSPFDFVGPTGFFNAGNLDNLPWIILQKLRPLEYYAATYGSAIGQRVQAEQAAGINVMSMVTTALGRSDLSETPCAMEVQLRLLPCKAWPRGLNLFGANGVILHKEDYPFGTYALEHFKDVEVPGVFYGKATVEFAISLQRSWNRDVSSLENFNIWMGKGKWLSPRNAKMEHDPDDTHGEVIQYTPVMGHKPEHVTLKNLPTSYQQNMARLQMSLENLFSQHEVSRGTNRSDIRSGEMVELLLEQDAHGGVMARATFEEGLERLLSRILQRIKKGYTNERVRTIGNTEKDMEVFAFKGADLRNCTAIRVQAQSSVPDSRLAREVRIERRFKEGFYGNPADPRVRRHVAKMLEDATLDDVFDESYLDESLGEWENEQLVKGIRVIANSYDSHVIHMEVHGRYLKQLRFQKAKQADPRVAALEMQFLMHMNLHQEFINQALKKQLMMTGGANGQKPS